MIENQRKGESMEIKFYINFHLKDRFINWNSQLAEASWYQRECWHHYLICDAILRSSI